MLINDALTTEICSRKRYRKSSIEEAVASAEKTWVRDHGIMTAAGEKGEGDEAGKRRNDLRREMAVSIQIQ